MVEVEKRMSKQAGMQFLCNYHIAIDDTTLLASNRAVSIDSISHGAATSYDAIV